MDILEQNKDKLKLTYYHGCSYMGVKNNKPHYIIGALIDEKGCGACGWYSRGICVPSCTVQDLSNKDPDSTVLSIEFKVNDFELYETILQKLNCYNDEIDIELHGDYHTSKRLGLKDNYLQNVEKINLENEEIKNQYNQLLSQLKFLHKKFVALGCHIDHYRIDEPCYTKIPHEWYEFEEGIDVTKSCITIMFHKQTQFYKKN